MINELNLKFLSNHGSFMIQNTPGIKNVDDRSFVVMNAKGNKKKKLPSMGNNGYMEPYQDEEKKVFDTRNVTIHYKRIYQLLSQFKAV